MIVKAAYYTYCPHYDREAEAEPEDGDTLAKRQLLGFAANLMSKDCECLNLHPRTTNRTKYDKTCVSFHLSSLILAVTWRERELTVDILHCRLKRRLMARRLFVHLLLTPEVCSRHSLRWKWCLLI